MKNAISWFEIPTIDIERAQKFYEAIFQIKLEPLETDNFKIHIQEIHRSSIFISFNIVNLLCSESSWQF